MKPTRVQFNYSREALVYDGICGLAFAAVLLFPFEKWPQFSAICVVLGIIFLTALFVDRNSIVSQACVFLATRFFVPSGKDSTLIIGIMFLGFALIPLFK